MDRNIRSGSGAADCADRPAATVEAATSYCAHEFSKASVACCTKRRLRRPGPSLQGYVPFATDLRERYAPLYVAVLVLLSSRP